MRLLAVLVVVLAGILPLEATSTKTESRDIRDLRFLLKRILTGQGNGGYQGNQESEDEEGGSYNKKDINASEKVNNNGGQSNKNAGQENNNGGTELINGGRGNINRGTEINIGGQGAIYKGPSFLLQCYQVLAKRDVRSATNADGCCPFGSVVRCVADPCAISTCSVPGAICKLDNCGGCFANWWDPITKLRVC